MSSARYLVGDVFDTLATIPDDSIDLVLTSPPFLALRSYLPADHPDKGKEIGSEPTPGAFIDTLLALTEEWARVLTPHGSICVELGDTYSGSGGAGGDYTPDGLRAAQPAFTGSAYARRVESTMPRTGPGRTTKDREGWPLDKSMCLIPELYRLSLAYGFNPLTGRQTPRWRVRNNVRWCRPNPPVGALGDKFRPATSDMVIACKSKDRYFDLDAVRAPASPNTDARTARGVAERPNDCKTSPDGNRDSLAIQHLHDTAPPLDWWQISTEPYKGSHYATWPTALLTRPIKAMCPTKVCQECGRPSERIVGDATYAPSATYRGGAMVADAERVGEGVNQWVGAGGAQASVVRQAPTLGWTDCGHDSWRPGVVLDTFAGSGTTLLVATGHGRDAIGIDLDARNADLARERVGMFLTVEQPEAVA